MGTTDLETGEEVIQISKKPSNKKVMKRVVVGSLDIMTDELTFEDSRLSPTKPSEDQEKRTAIIEVAESCDLLCIKRDQFQSIFLNLVEKELDAKLKVLLEIPFLQVKNALSVILILLEKVN